MNLNLYKVRTNKFGVDVDTKSKYVNKRVVDRIETLVRNDIVSSYTVNRSKHGFHYLCSLTENVEFMRSIELRHYCMDDPLRMIKDVLKVWNGATEFDLLFTKKWKGWK